MKNIVLIATLLITFILIPSLAFSKGLIEYRLIGFTTTTTNGLIAKPDGSEGYLAMHRYCQDEVDPDSRACFASEASGPSGVPVLAGDAWVISSRDVTVLLDSAQKFVAVDTGSGCVVSSSKGTAVDAVRNLDCISYRNNKSTFFGQAVSSFTGIVKCLTPCAQVLPIACCAPVSVSVP